MPLAAWMRPGISMWILKRGRRRRRRPFEGKKVWAANPIIVAMLEERGALLARSTAGTLVSALLALPQSGDLPGDGAVVHRRWRRR